MTVDCFYLGDGLGGGYSSMDTFLNWLINFAITEKKSSESVLGGSPNCI